MHIPFLLLVCGATQRLASAKGDRAKTTRRNSRCGRPQHTLSDAPLCCPQKLYPSHRAAAERRSIHPYNNTIAPTKPSSPSHGASAKSSGTSPIGAFFDKLTMRPALITLHKLSPTINPDVGRYIPYLRPAAECFNIRCWTRALHAVVGRHGGVNQSTGGSPSNAGHRKGWRCFHREGGAARR